MNEAIMHDFSAKCLQGHQRNFVWATDSTNKLTEVHDTFCVLCGKHTTFKIERYWQEPEKESTFSVTGGKQ